MRASIVVFTLLAGALLVVVNSEGTAHSVSAVLIGMILMLAAWVLLPIRTVGKIRERYVAFVYVEEYGQPNHLWSNSYNSRIVAWFAARRMALRMDFLGDAYSPVNIRWEVQDLRPRSVRTKSA